MSIKNFISESLKIINDNKITNNILNNMKPVNNSDVLYVFNTGNSNYYKKIYLLLAHQLNQRGQQCMFLYKDHLFNGFFSNININNEQISNSLLPGSIQFTCKTKQDRYYDWDIRPEKQIIKTNNVNFYPFIINTLRLLHQCFTIDFTNKKVIADCKSMIDTCDMFYHYFQLLQKYSQDNNVKICFIGWESDLIPNCVFKTLCEKTNHDGFKFIIVQRGYPSYHGHNFRESYIAAVNMTHTDRIHFFSVTKNELLNNKTINQDIINLFEDKLKPKHLAISSDKKYKKTFVLFSHLFYDFYDNPSVENTSFPDLLSWIKETINYFNKDKENMLILKPHPLELNPSYPQKEPVETLNGFIDDNNIKLNHNVVLFPPDFASTGSLVPHMDCGLLWGSTVALELIYKKIPIIVAGYPPYYGVLDVPFAKTNDEYFDMIQNIDKIVISNEQKQQVIRYMDCMLQKDVFVKQLYYDNILRTNFFDKKNVNSYLEKGDSNINKLIDKIIR